MSVSYTHLDVYKRQQRGLLDHAGERCRALLPRARKLAVVTDSHVLPLYLERTADSLKRAGFQVRCCSVPAGEAAKSPEQLVLQMCIRDRLKELGKTRKPILLKRGLANTVKELLMSAEYIMASGNENVILCERGIRTFETATRNTLDLSAVSVLPELSHLPVIVDPSHATGVARYVKPMALAAAACGADGLIIEVHNDPPHALCDGAQSLRPEQFEDVARAVRRVRAAALTED